MIKIAPTPDHKAVQIKVDFNQNSRGPGFWKLNVNVLNDQEYIETVLKTS